MTKDISNKTVAILIVISLIVTVIGTWIILEKFNDLKPMQVDSDSESSGKLSIEVLGQKSAPKSRSSGEITVNIVPNN